MTLASAMVLGADCIEDYDLLRRGQTGAVLGHHVAAPSALGTFCARSRSVMPASSTPSRPRRSRARGRPAPIQATELAIPGAVYSALMFLTAESFAV